VNENVRSERERESEGMGRPICLLIEDDLLVGWRFHVDGTRLS
jgi:hypothetical protein